MLPTLPSQDYLQREFVLCSFFFLVFLSSILFKLGFIAHLYINWWRGEQGRWRRWYRDCDCPYASNLYSDCPEYCFEKMLEKLQDVGKEPVYDKGMKKVQRKGVTPTSLKAVKPFKSCVGNFFLVNPLAYQERTKGMWVMTDRSDVHPYCKNASNPYHKCAEYCFKNISKKEQPGQVMKLKSLEGDKIFNSRGRTTSLQPQCIYASNPQHECTEFCSQNGPDSKTREGENFMDASTNNEKSSALSNHIHPSIPYHKGVDCCLENTAEQKHPQKALNPNEKIKTLVAAESGVKLECKNASYHIYDEYCFQNLPEDHDLEAIIKTKEEKEVLAIPQTEMNSGCENVSDPYIEYCFKNVTEMDKPGLTFMKVKEENKVGLPGERWVNPECQFASNPCHVCAEYCFQNAFEKGRSRHVVKLRSLRRTVSNKETTSVHPWCKFVSNPYHECGAGCFQNELDQNKAEGAIMKLKKEKKIVVLGERGVNPECQFASNPYHECAEYCFQNVPERENRGHVMKLNNQQELNKVVCNRETTNVHPRCKFASNSYHECDAYCFQNELDQNITEGVTESKEGKKETSYAQRRDVNTNYKFASNPFHKCDEYCSEEHPDKNQPVECMTVITKERNSPSEMKYHLIMEKSIINLEFVEASNPDSDYVELSEGITMQVVSKDLMPEEVEMKITKEPSYVQPLQSDASDLFLEWAKYCSQEKASEYKIFMQVERKAFAKKNGHERDNLKYYDSSNLEKVKGTGSLQRSLLTSILFFIGYLFALFKWTEVIHSLVKSSERKNSRRVIHKKHVESNESLCDAYHKMF